MVCLFWKGKEKWLITVRLHNGHCSFRKRISRSRCQIFRLCCDSLVTFIIQNGDGLCYFIIGLSLLLFIFAAHCAEIHQAAAKVFHLYLWAVPEESVRYGLPLGHSSHQAAAVDYRLCL